MNVRVPQERHTYRNRYRRCRSPAGAAYLQKPLQKMSESRRGGIFVAPLRRMSESRRGGIFVAPLRRMSESHRGGIFVVEGE